MKAYIQTDKTGNFYNVNAFIANEGFELLGWETQKYFSVDEITDNDPETLIVGGIGNVRKRLKHLGIDKPLTEIDYPLELTKYLELGKFAPRKSERAFCTTYQCPYWNLFVKLLRK